MGSRRITNHLRVFHIKQTAITFQSVCLEYFEVSYLLQKMSVSKTSPSTCIVDQSLEILELFLLGVIFSFNFNKRMQILTQDLQGLNWWMNTSLYSLVRRHFVAVSIRLFSRVKPLFFHPCNFFFFSFEDSKSSDLWAWILMAI